MGGWYGFDVDENRTPVRLRNPVRFWAAPRTAAMVGMVYGTATLPGAPGAHHLMWVSNRAAVPYL